MRQFDISAPVPTPTPLHTAFASEILPQTIAVVLAVSAIVIGAGLLVYFKKRKH
jgi:hypothetical protein